MKCPTERHSGASEECLLVIVWTVLLKYDDDGADGKGDVDRKTVTMALVVDVAVVVVG